VSFVRHPGQLLVVGLRHVAGLQRENVAVLAQV
jgi:hypothetical protein